MEDYIIFNCMSFNEITLILLIEGILTVREVIQVRIRYEHTLKNMNYGKN